eukprot:4696465-Ditylum_brightwellii.AAC.1
MKARKWAKAPDERQDAIFVTKGTTLSQFETYDCFDCGEKGGTAKSHISTQCPYPQKMQQGRGRGNAVA